MNDLNQFEDSASRSRSKHEGESSQALCDRLSRTRATSPRQLPTDHDHAVPTRAYQIDQSSPILLRLPLALSSKQRQRQKPTHSRAAIDRVTPYQGLLTLLGWRRREPVFPSSSSEERAVVDHWSNERSAAAENRENWPRPFGLWRKFGHTLLPASTGGLPQPSAIASSGQIFARNAIHPNSVNRP